MIVKYQYATDTGEKSEASKTKKFFIALFVILLIGAVGFLIYWFAIRDNSKPEFEVLTANQNYASIEYTKEGNTITLKATPKYNVEFYGWRYGEDGVVFSTTLTTTVEFQKQDDTVVYYADFRNLNDSSFEYDFNDVNDTAIITSYDSSAEDLIMPSFVTNQWDFYTVVDYDLDFSQNTSLKSLVISENIDTIKANTFTDVSTLESVKFGGGLLHIEDQAFAGTALQSISLPKSVSYIAGDAFANCQNLQNIEVSQDNTTFSSDGNDIVKDITTNKLIVGSSSSVIAEGITVIGDYAFSGRNITTLSLPNTVRKIGSYAFENTPLESANINHVTIVSEGAFKNCSNLSQVIISTNSTMTEIGADAFNSCSSLTMFTVPQTVKAIGDSAFANCLSLENFGFAQNTVIEQIGELALMSTAISSFYLPSTVTSIGDGILAGCTNLTSIQVGDENTIYTDKDSNIIVDVQNKTLLASCSTSANVFNDITAIANYAFYGVKNDSLVNVNLPATIKSIGDKAFGKSSVASINIQNVSSLGEAIFENCEDLTTITLPSTLTTIPQSTFAGTKALTSLKLSENITTIAQNAFANSNIKEVVFANKTSNIVGDNAFSDCQNLTKITFATDLENLQLGKNSFKGTQNLKSISLDATNVTIQDNAFVQSGVEKVTLGINNNITNHAFYENQSIKELALPENVATVNIGDYAFYSTANLTSIDFKNATVNVGEFAFSKSGISSINLGDVQTIKESAFAYCANLQSVSMNENAPIQTIGKSAFYQDSLLYTVSLSTNITTIESSAFMDSSVVNINLQNIQVIQDYAFANCKKLSLWGVLSISEKLNYIGKKAFFSCDDIVLVAINSNINYIGDYAFAECDNLASVSFADDSTLETIGEGAFSSNPKLKQVFLPDNLKTINSLAFSDTAINSITIPESVGTIDDRAFGNCINLAEVTIDSGIVFNRITSKNSQGYLIANAITINVEASLIDNDGLKSSYLDSSAFTRAKSQDGKYYVYSLKA